MTVHIAATRTCRPPNFRLLIAASTAPTRREDSRRGDTGCGEMGRPLIFSDAAAANLCGKNMQFQCHRPSNRNGDDRLEATTGSPQGQTVARRKRATPSALVTRSVPFPDKDDA